MAVNYLTIIVSIIMLITMAGTTTIVTRSEKLTMMEPGLMEQATNYSGIWITADGHIRQELLPNGRYDKARGSRQHAYNGRYEIKNSHIRYWDDTGFTASGDFSGKDTLYHGGHVFYRETPKR
ncbi:Atu4866 domain-containing protein [Flavitalea sp.]|nr:Atu4866 domain-containing protein [Flavitalea sp.]